MIVRASSFKKKKMLPYYRFNVTIERYIGYSGRPNNLRGRLSVADDSVVMWRQ